MKIAQVSLAVHHGGAERIALDLHRAHRAAGHHACLLVGRGPADEPGSVFLDPLAGRPAAVRALAGISPHLARPLAAARRWRGYDVHDQPATDRLLDHAAAALGGPPDVLHLHALAGSYLDLRQLPRLSAAVPTVLTLHDAWALTGGGHHQHAGDPRAAAAAHNLAVKQAAFADSHLHVAAPSRWLIDQVAGSILAPAALATHVVPHGIDPTVFTPGDRAAARQRLGLPTHGYRALFVAFAATPDHPCKDLPTVTAAAGLAQTPDLTFDVVGTAGRRDGRVCFHGPVRDRDRLADHYRAADVLLHAAHAENFPTVILESLACGTPVIATAVGGIPEQLDEGVTGLLVPPRSPDALTQALDGLLANAPRRNEMARAARRAATDHFAAPAMAQRYVSLYEAATTCPPSP